MPGTTEPQEAARWRALSAALLRCTSVREWCQVLTSAVLAALRATRVVIAFEDLGDRGPAHPGTAPESGPRLSLEISAPVRQRGCTLGWITATRTRDAGPFEDVDARALAELAHVAARTWPSGGPPRRGASAPPA